MSRLPTERPSQTVSEVLAAQDAAKSVGRFGMTPSLVRLYAILAPACLVIMATNGYDASVLTGLQGVNQWREHFGNPKGILLGLTTASLPFGGILSTPIAAIVSDRFGRRISILVGSFIMICGVVVQAVGTSIYVFLGGRIIIGFGITLALAAGPILISELAHPRHRVLFSGLFNTTFYLGALLAGWITFGSWPIPNDWAWRLPTLLQAAPATLQMAFVCFLPESPRWLLYRDRSEEAFEILVKHHGAGDRDDPLVLAEFWEMNEAIAAEKAMKKEGPKMFFKTPANRKRLFILVTFALFGQWSGNGLVSYYLTKILTSIGITTQSEQTLLNGTIATVNYATALLAAALSTKIGRRKMFVGGSIAIFISFCSLTASLAVYNEFGYNSASKSALAFIFIYFTSYNVALNPLLFVYPVEILTYQQRAVGVSIFVLTTKCASLINQFVNPIGMDALGWKFYLVYVVILLIEMATFYFVYPETQGYTLERTMEVFGESIKFDGAEEKGMLAETIEESEGKRSGDGSAGEHVEKTRPQ